MNLQLKNIMIILNRDIYIYVYPRACHFLVYFIAKMRSNLREQDCCCVQQIQECVSAEEWLIESTRTSLLAAVSVGEK